MTQMFKRMHPNKRRDLTDKEINTLLEATFYSASTSRAGDLELMFYSTKIHKLTGWGGAILSIPQATMSVGKSLKWGKKNMIPKRFGYIRVHCPVTYGRWNGDSGRTIYLESTNTLKEVVEKLEEVHAQYTPIMVMDRSDRITGCRWELKRVTEE